MKQDELIELLNTPKATGYTTWILEAAIVNPKCIIVAKDKILATQLKLKYKDMIKWDYYYKGIIPMFTWIDELHNDYPSYLNLKVPIIFDNSCFFLKPTKETK